MSRTVLAALELPKAAVLTRALTAPGDPGIEAAGLEGIGERLRDAARARAGRGGRLRVDAFTLKSGPLAPGSRPDPTPFAWSPRTARRRIGLAAVRACVGGTAPNLVDAVASSVRTLVDTGASGAAAPGSLATWLASAGPGVIGAVRADALTWATRLFTTLEWSRLGPGSTIGGPDEWWDVPGAPGVCLRGRCDVRIMGPPAESGGPRQPVALLTMVGGRPAPTARAELALAGLVAALGSGAAVAARVAGYWPECGRALVLPVDDELLEHCAASVLAVLGAADQPEVAGRTTVSVVAGDPIGPVGARGPDEGTAGEGAAGLAA